MRTPSLSARGFSILETMIAMVVLSVGLVGALGALQRGAVESRLGQNRQAKTMLADAAIQRIKLPHQADFGHHRPRRGRFSVDSRPHRPVDVR